MDCETNYYKTDDGKGGSPSCQTCPEGGTCKDNAFTGKLTGSIWTPVTQKIDGKMILVMRVAACPVGFSLVRSLFNPAGDTCQECPPQTYNIEGSEWSGSDTAPGTFCSKCPAEGADCPVPLLPSQTNNSPPHMHPGHSIHVPETVMCWIMACIH